MGAALLSVAKKSFRHADRIFQNLSNFHLVILNIPKINRRKMS